MPSDSAPAAADTRHPAMIHPAAGDAEVSATPASPDSGESRVGFWWWAMTVAVIIWMTVMAVGFVGSILLALALVGFFVILAAGTVFALSRL
ncbi:hypothetical protein [Gordonia polyisoprenivorans]|nr:hypothetical protein [Gordonia polyisoprenivorans]UZF56803.1 hypothetical protein LH935_01990 [Gordonia polyisoprenivorans]WCB37874.1 hypothetical protein PHA63_01550 [Gordonia polyisoprenivorans]